MSIESRPKFAIGECVEVLTTEGVLGWGRIIRRRWFDDDDGYEIMEEWCYQVDLDEESWFPEQNLRTLSIIEVMAYEACG